MAAEYVPPCSIRQCILRSAPSVIYWASRVNLHEGGVQEGLQGENSDLQAVVEDVCRGRHCKYQQEEDEEARLPVVACDPLCREQDRAHQLPCTIILSHPKEARPSLLIIKCTKSLMDIYTIRYISEQDHSIHWSSDSLLSRKKV